MLGVAHIEVVDAGGGQLDAEIGIGVLGLQAGALVLKVVVEGQLFAGGIGQSDDRIQRGIEPAGDGFGDDFIAGAALEAEDIPLARFFNAPVDDNGKGDRLGGGLGMVAFPEKKFPARCPRQRGGGWKHWSPYARKAGKCPAQRPGHPG